MCIQCFVCIYIPVQRTCPTVVIIAIACTFSFCAISTKHIVCFIGHCNCRHWLIIRCRHRCCPGCRCTLVVQCHYICLGLAPCAIGGFFIPRIAFPRRVATATFLGVFWTFGAPITRLIIFVTTRCRHTGVNAPLGHSTRHGRCTCDIRHNTFAITHTVRLGITYIIAAICISRNIRTRHRTTCTCSIQWILCAGAITCPGRCFITCIPIGPVF